jgi:hypothetical protein
MYSILGHAHILDNLYVGHLMNYTCTNTHAHSNTDAHTHTHTNTKRTRNTENAFLAVAFQRGLNKPGRFRPHRQHSVNSLVPDGRAQPPRRVCPQCRPR